MSALHQFGVWYFDVGWIITTILSALAGIFSKNLTRAVLWIVVVLIVGLFAFYCKHFL